MQGIHFEYHQNTRYKKVNNRINKASFLGFSSTIFPQIVRACPSNISFEIVEHNLKGERAKDTQIWV